jgi:hypothetical protein
MVPEAEDEPKKTHTGEQIAALRRRVKRAKKVGDQ